MFNAKGLHVDVAWLVTDPLGNLDWMKPLWEFGLTIPLGAALALLIFFRGSAEMRCFVSVCAIVFIVTVFVSFAQWPWDNMKLILWSWLVVAPYIWQALIKPLPIPARGAACVLLFFSGAVSLMGGLDSRHGYKIANRSDVAIWADAVRDIPPTDTFAIEPEYNHPLLLLGRKLVCGYDGHLWSHGLNYQAKMETLKRLLALAALVGGRRAHAERGVHGAPRAGRQRGGPALRPDGNHRSQPAQPITPATATTISGFTLVRVKISRANTGQQIGRPMVIGRAAHDVTARQHQADRERRETFLDRVSHGRLLRFSPRTCATKKTSNPAGES